MEPSQATAEGLIQTTGESHAVKVSFEDVVAPHWQAMSRVAMRLSGPNAWEDVLQDALAVAWRRLRTFDSNRGSARAWLLSITYDQARKTWRRARRLETVPLYDFPADSADHAGNIDLERALARLTMRQRSAIELHYFVGLSVDEVSVVMSCSAGTVKSTLSDARARLRGQLTHE